MNDITQNSCIVHPSPILLSLVTQITPNSLILDRHCRKNANPLLLKCMTSFIDDPQGPEP